MTSATERLRALLDERGVEHFDGCESTLWGYERTSESTGTYRYSADEISDGFVNVWLHHLTPEQAVVATLGETPTPPPPTMPEQPPYDLLIDLLRGEWGIDVSWDGLRRFWYVGLNEKGMRMRDEREAATLGPAYEPPIAAHWDGDVLVLTTPRDPSSVHVQRAEGQPRKVYPSEATLGPGTCRIDLVGHTEREDRFQCRSCDWSMSVRRGTWPRLNYCPGCGRTVVE